MVEFTHCLCAVRYPLLSQLSEEGRREDHQLILNTLALNHNVNLPRRKKKMVIKYIFKRGKIIITSVGLLVKEI